MGGKVLVPSQEAVQKLIAARLAADVLGVPTVILARTDAEAADAADERRRRQRQAVRHRRAHRRRLLRDQERPRAGDQRGLAYAPYADLVWCETGTPDLDFAATFAEAIRANIPASCWPTTARPRSTGRRNLDDATIAKFQRELGAMGYKFQFITLAGYPQPVATTCSTWPTITRTKACRRTSPMQEPEFAARDRGYTCVSHQREVGTGYFDNVTTRIQGGRLVGHRAHRLDRGRAVPR